MRSSLRGHNIAIRCSQSLRDIRSDMVTKSKNGSAAPKQAEAEEPSGAIAGAESGLFVQSVEKAMRVLSAFDGTKRQLSLSEIANLVDMPLGAAQRCTFTLSTLGYLKKDPDSRKYELAPRVLDLAYHYVSSSDLVARATPFLRQISVETEEVTNLFVLDGAEVVVVQRFVSRHVLIPQVVVGTRMPAYCTASGIAILAAMPDKDVADLLAKSKIVSYTPKTMVEKSAILREIEKTRQKGYSRLEDQLYMGDISLGAAIKDSSGAAVGGVTLAISRTRWEQAQERHFGDMIMSAAAAASIVRRA